MINNFYERLSIDNIQNINEEILRLNLKCGTDCDKVVNKLKIINNICVTEITKIKRKLIELNIYERELIDTSKSLCEKEYLNKNLDIICNKIVLFNTLAIIMENQLHILDLFDIIDDIANELQNNTTKRKIETVDDTITKKPKIDNDKNL